MQFSSQIVPAIIPQSFADLETQVTALTGLAEIHVDVIDGVFAPATSWPYRDSASVSVAYTLLETFSLEVDLMVEKPMRAAEDWLKAGADQLVFHIETIEASVLETFTMTHDVTVGVALSSATPLENVYPYLPFVDYVQVMGIDQIGMQGQPFDTRVFDRISTLKEMYPTLSISIDGSVNTVTLPQLKKFGLSRFIVGSAIAKSSHPKEAYHALVTLLQS